MTGASLLSTSDDNEPPDIRLVAVIAMTVFASAGSLMAWLMAAVLGLGPTIVMMRLVKEQPRASHRSP
jgi:hypothetical protein